MASAEPSSVEIRNGQSLYSICIQILRTCDSKDLEQFINLNPSLRDPKHIRPGTKVIVPAFSNGPNGDAGLQKEQVSPKMVKEAGIE
jgi:hypothetical protein